MINDSTVDVQGASQLMRANPETVYKLINDGTLPAGRIGKAFIMLKKDVINHIESTIIRQTAERMGAPRRSPHTRR